MHSLGSQTVEVRRPRLLVAIGAEYIAGVIVGEDEKEIGLPRGASNRLRSRDARSRQSRKNAASCNLTHRIVLSQAM
jgi:hypothetical protein